ncbi:alginate O-acetyltransferase complex protein AlgI [Sedimentibacter acidaminivorans]|uniref:Alginate O-acetyltransferase complex protein AlgI n=1 Tax=Sedimentibacter acidaminivorans TaxID=913099 RepID=A0ABS4GEK2_9FIRM|nr:alginate O-acetyltransferase complex protein AlgI [Sedimentibacter acidaminivorans]
MSFSLFFYAWGEPFFISVLLFSGFVNYFFALLVDKYRGNFKSKLSLFLAIFIDLGLLGYFKYYNFFVDNLNLVMNTNIGFSKFGLPIGISFYTFQIISYVVDVYRQDVPAQKKFYKLLLYMSLYHQLIAGPIVRYKDIEHEIDNRVITASNMSYGINRFIIGLGKKVLIANTAGQTATIFLGSNFSELSVLGAWLGIILYTLQIYFDFSGYSDMAIGLGRLFGFTYKENFNYPYIARNVKDFWRRWHISLSSFFRDYVYIPLGGNRHHSIRNLLFVWMLTGFWHGASWNFIFWGLYYGIFLLLERTILSKIIEKLPSVISHIYLLIVVTVGWVFFYFLDLSQALKFISILFGFSKNALYDIKFEVEFFNNIVFLVIAFLCCTPIFKVLGSKFIEIFNLEGKHTYVLYAIFNATILIIATIMLIGQTYNPFLYFRF